jgi:hypothetical protein
MITTYYMMDYPVTMYSYLVCITDGLCSYYDDPVIFLYRKMMCYNKFQSIA